MAKKKRAVPGINSSSTADIAFMLLIFFLITTSMDTDRGLARRLPPPPEQNQKDDNILKKERNVLQVRLNKDDQLMCGKEYIDGLNKSAVSTPVVMSVSLLDIKNYGLGLGYNRVSITVQEERLIFTEIVFKNLSINENEYKELIKPLLDNLANTIGQESIN